MLLGKKQTNKNLKLSSLKKKKKKYYHGVAVAPSFLISLLKHGGVR